MELTIRERLALSEVLPQEGSFIEMKAINEFQEQIKLQEGEIKLINLRFDPVKKTATWNEKSAPLFEVEIDEIVQTLLSKILKQLDKEHKLRSSYVTLYTKFVQ